MCEILNFLTKNQVLKIIFHKTLTQFLEDVSVAVTIAECETINFQTTVFLYFKNYGCLTRVTRLKFASNMGDPIVLDTLYSPNRRTIDRVHRFFTLSCS